MNKELKKRIFTSIILLSLLTAMYFYTFIMICSTMIIAIIIWIEFYALISKIIKGNRYQDYFFRYISKSASLLYLSILVYFIFIIESDYADLKIYLLYSVLIAILSDIGGLVFGKTFKGPKLTKISPKKTYSGVIGSFILSVVGSLIFIEYFVGLKTYIYLNYLSFEQYGINLNLFILFFIFN